ncbi:MAG TPA: hypothetical protein VGQ55_05945 [Pyrinomonadaceae bacterium]|nr:hypothetical protein [Pyrinomonadaceae bacterium]
MRLLPLALLVSLVIAAAGCGPSASDNTARNTSAVTASNTANTDSSNDNVEELRMLINVPFVPEDVRFQQSAGVNEKKLTAVLLYSKEDAAKLTSQLSAQGKGKPDEITTEDWFPPELLSQSDLGGESTLKGESYKADELLQPPYTAGTVTRVTDSNYFVVQLTAK